MHFNKPQFTQGQILASLQKENDYLRTQAQAMAQTTRLIEAAVTGLASQLTDPAQIAELAVQVAGAVIQKLEKLGEEPDPAV